MTDPSKQILAVVSDLMFTVKIQDAAKRLGLEPVFVQSQSQALSQARQKPALIILDLNHSAADPLNTIARLKADAETSSVRLLAYVSHVQVDLKRAAEEQGCDVVMPRSAFSQNLPAVLSRYVAE